jgi:hypothetical protein
MSKKLQNIDAVNKMLAGEHKFQTNKTYGFSESKKNTKTRLVGEIWQDTDPKSGITYQFEQKDGYVMKTKFGSETLQSTRDSLAAFSKCPKETCTCKSPNRLDLKMKRIHDMCFDCVIEMENNLRIEGKFNEYAKERIKTNAIEWIKRAEQDVELLKQAYTKTYEVVTNADGKTKTIDARMTPEEFTEKVEREFQEYREKFMQQVTKLENQDD